MWLNNTVAKPAGRPKAASLSNSGLLDRRDALYLGLQPMVDRFDLQALARRPISPVRCRFLMCIPTKDCDSGISLAVQPQPLLTLSNCTGSSPIQAS